MRRHHYNHHRFHTAIGGPPAYRGTHLSGQYTPGSAMTLVTRPLWSRTHRR